MMKNSEVFQRIVSDINSDGLQTSPRERKIKELINYMAYFDNAYNLAFDFTSRKFSWKYLAAELLWYLSGDLQSKDIKNYAKLRGEISDNKGMVNSNYGYIVFLRYIKGYYNQYNRVIDSLKKDKDSRQAIIRYNDDKHAYEGNKDFVCTESNQFLIRNNKLYMTFNMRSSDIYYGLQYDLVWFGLLLQSVRLDLLATYPDLELGYICYNSGSTHFYEHMFETSDYIVGELGKEYKLELLEPFSDTHKDVFNSEQYREQLKDTTDYKGFIEKNFKIKITKDEK